MPQISFPRMVRVRQRFKAPVIKDVEKEVSRQIAKSRLKEKIKLKDRVAITAGSRGISHIVEITASIVKEVKKVGGDPFIVPSMGSHGGANCTGAGGGVKKLRNY